MRKLAIIVVLALGVGSCDNNFNIVPDDGDPLTIRFEQADGLFWSKRFEPCLRRLSVFDERTKAENPVWWLSSTQRCTKVSKLRLGRPTPGFEHGGSLRGMSLIGIEAEDGEWRRGNSQTIELVHR
jgi:hypothetical protein